MQGIQNSRARTGADGCAGESRTSEEVGRAPPSYQARPSRGARKSEPDRVRRCADGEPLRSGAVEISSTPGHELVDPRRRTAAPNPLSMFTTVSPPRNCSASRGARRASGAPYPTLVGTAITGTGTRPDHGGSAPSISHDDHDAGATQRLRPPSSRAARPRRRRGVLRGSQAPVSTASSATARSLIPLTTRTAIGRTGTSSGRRWTIARADLSGREPRPRRRALHPPGSRRPPFARRLTMPTRRRVCRRRATSDTRASASDGGRPAKTSPASTSSAAPRRCEPSPTDSTGDQARRSSAASAKRRRPRPPA